jgi:hypothetical protein
VKNSIKNIAYIMLVFFSSNASPIQAGEITAFGWHSGVASTASTFIDPAPVPNDNVAGPSSYELYVTQKNYIAIGPVDITFDVINNGGTTEYRVKEGVFNGTGVPWGAYHLELGYGFDAGFVKSPSGDGLDFDSPDYDSPVQFDPSLGPYFPSYVNTEDDIYASGGVMPPTGFSQYFRFNIDVPDGITQFTLRQSPVGVPEPCTCGVGILATICGAAVRVRRHSPKSVKEAANKNF